jgi:hypothetical protein
MIYHHAIPSSVDTFLDSIPYLNQQLYIQVLYDRSIYKDDNQNFYGLSNKNVQHDQDEIHKKVTLILDHI